MKKKLLLIIMLAGAFIQTTAQATNLMQVYQDALTSDPTFQQAIEQRLANKEAVPISLSNLLPSLGLTYYPSVSKSWASGSATNGGTATVRGSNLTLTLLQTIFNFSDFANLASATSISKQADATLNAAAQNLMVRVATAYFNILHDEDNLRAIEANKAAYEKQLEQVTQQYKVGIKTVTDVYTAQASYDQAVADYIQGQTQLNDDKENLRAITGKIYPKLAVLSKDFPLVAPHPADINSWADTAQKQNWTVKADQYAADSARAIIKQQFGGHLPTVAFQATYNADYNRYMNGTSLLNFPGSSNVHSKAAQLNVNVPLVQGGLVVSQTHQAQYQYQVAIQQLELQLRSTINTTRQSYLGVISSISKIKADKQTIKSSLSSLEGMRAGYSVGTQILINVLQQQQQVFQAVLQYASDRYAYINNYLALKQATGILAPEDLEAINAWLIETSYVEAPVNAKKFLHSIGAQAAAKQQSKIVHAYESQKHFTKQSKKLKKLALKSHQTHKNIKMAKYHPKNKSSRTYVS